MHTEQWPTPAPTRDRPNLGLFALIGGFATTMFGLFTLPLQDPPGNAGLDGVYFSTLNQFAGLHIPVEVLGGVAKAWWSYLALVLFGVLAAAAAAAAAFPAMRRLCGWLCVLLTLAVAALFTVASQQTGNFQAVARGFRRTGSAFDVVGTGLYVTYIGLGVMLIGALVVGLVPGGLPAAPPPAGPGPYPPAGWQQQQPPLGPPGSPGQHSPYAGPPVA